MSLRLTKTNVVIFIRVILNGILLSWKILSVYLKYILYSDIKASIYNKPSIPAPLKSVAGSVP